jgi:hypothetical protein
VPTYAVTLGDDETIGPVEMEIDDPDREDWTAELVGDVTQAEGWEAGPTRVAITIGESTRWADAEWSDTDRRLYGSTPFA